MLWHHGTHGLPMHGSMGWPARLCPMAGSPYQHAWVLQHGPDLMGAPSAPTAIYREVVRLQEERGEGGQSPLDTYHCCCHHDQLVVSKEEKPAAAAEVSYVALRGCLLQCHLPPFPIIATALQIMAVAHNSTPMGVPAGPLPPDCTICSPLIVPCIPFLSCRTSGALLHPTPRPFTHQPSPSHTCVIPWGSGRQWHPGRGLRHLASILWLDTSALLGKCFTLHSKCPLPCH